MDILDLFLTDTVTYPMYGYVQQEGPYANGMCYPVEGNAPSGVEKPKSPFIGYGGGSCSTTPYVAYDNDSEFALVATKTGILTVRNRIRSIVPLEIWTNEEIRSFILHMLWENSSLCENTGEVENLLSEWMKRKDLELDTIICNPSDSHSLSHKKIVTHTSIPEGYLCAVPEPEYLGRIARYFDKCGIVRIGSAVIWTTVEKNSHTTSAKLERRPGYGWRFVPFLKTSN